MVEYKIKPEARLSALFVELKELKGIITRAHPQKIRVAYLLERTTLELREVLQDLKKKP